MEVVQPGSEQYNPSFEEFDSGIDILVSPRKYIVWSTRMNTHILPEFVISFRFPSNLKSKEMGNIYGMFGILERTAYRNVLQLCTCRKSKDSASSNFLLLALMKVF
ncbi:unnamed protein product [Fraxinus pennsylvanica]|uniref:PARP catalytic domain-containing protein n=1 Tax=Fraxinus pennsylvanica TaxID=56036 RepID=A0AAD1ZTN2_9LAMI|nr:unnamed protein product [Fraxinus pennsylvanica]